jgi:hypothetical protein
VSPHVSEKNQEINFRQNLGLDLKQKEEKLWKSVSTITEGQLTVRADNFCAAVLLRFASILLHAFWLNKGLEKYDAYFCIIFALLYIKLHGLCLQFFQELLFMMIWLFYTMISTSYLLWG